MEKNRSVGRTRDQPRLDIGLSDRIDLSRIDNALGGQRGVGLKERIGLQEGRYIRLRRRNGKIALEFCRRKCRTHIAGNDPVLALPLKGQEEEQFVF